MYEHYLSGRVFTGYNLFNYRIRRLKDFDFQDKISSIKIQRLNGYTKKCGVRFFDNNDFEGSYWDIALDSNVDWMESKVFDNVDNNANSVHLWTDQATYFSKRNFKSATALMSMTRSGPRDYSRFGSRSHQSAGSRCS